MLINVTLLTVAATSKSLDFPRFVWISKRSIEMYGDSEAMLDNFSVSVA